jgi:beta-mannanase
MNGTWYPEWSRPGVSASAYVAAWRHIWTVFHQAGATNAAFVWCPNVGEFGGQAWTDWYPGSAYVDWVGLDAYPEPSNLAADVSGTGGLDALARFAERTGKPAMLAEWAPGEPAQDPAATFDAVFAWAARYPDAVKALVYFNFGSTDQDYVLPDDPTGAAAMRRLVARDKTDLYGIGTVA